MKLSNILTVYIVLLDALAIELLLTANCLAHSLIAIGIGTMGLVTLYLVRVLKENADMHTIRPKRLKDAKIATGK